jgi:hypothetical protein
MLSDTNPLLGAEGFGMPRTFSLASVAGICKYPSLFMGSPKSTPPPAPAPEEHDGLEESVHDLACEVSTLSQQVETLRVAIDDLREELQFAIRNLPREPWVPVQPVVSMPRDPLADPFTINRTRREDVPAEGAPPSAIPEPPVFPPVAVELPATSKRRRKKSEELF